MDYLKRQAGRIVPTILLAIGIVVAFAVFIQDNAERISDQNEEYLSELTRQRAISIDNLISENLTFIQTTAYLYSKRIDSSSFVNVAVIRDYEESSVFDMLRFVDANGDNYTSKGMQSNLADRDYIKAGMRGESGVTFVFKSRVTGQKQVGFYAPVIKDGAVIGVMVGFYGEDYLDKLLEYGLFGYEGEGWLCMRDGMVIGSTVPDEPANYLDYMAEGGKCDAREIERVKEAFTEGRNTSLTYSEGGNETTAYGVALEQVDWVLVRNFPPSASGQILRNANSEGVRLITALVIMFALYALVMALTFVLDMRRTREASRQASDISKGMSTLFETFMTVDMAEGTYEYIGGTQSRIGLPPRGDYGDFVARLLERIPEEESRPEVEQVMDIESLRKKLATSNSVIVRVHVPIVDEVEWLTYNAIAIERNDDGSPARLLVVRQDVTDLYNKEQEEQRKLEKALDAAERASHAKTEFLFNMSHDLRTPMNAIIGYTELASREDVSPDQIREFIAKIASSSTHLLSLINDILEMSRIESGKMTLDIGEADIVKVVDETYEMFLSQMQGKGLAFSADTAGVADRWVLCDLGRLQRVALNLVSNAYKFTPEGGSVMLGLVQEGREGDKACFALHVKDTGIGMSPDFVSKLFSPFERERTSTVSKTEGTGLGLSITKQIIELMGGTVDVATEQGKGTEFIVRVALPICEDKTAGERDCAPEQEGTVDFAGKRLLLVEDNAINLEIASMILEQAGFVLESVVNGQEAVDKVAASSPGYFDAVLMDIQMPVMDGYAATRAIRALSDPALASVPIVAMTANAFKEDIQAAEDAGMDGHIAKPLDVAKMLSVLADVLRARE